jgi:nitrogen fixation protein NifU and related proteins
VRLPDRARDAAVEAHDAGADPGGSRGAGGHARCPRARPDRARTRSWPSPSRACTRTTWPRCSTTRGRGAGRAPLRMAAAPGARDLRVGSRLVRRVQRGHEIDALVAASDGRPSVLRGEVRPVVGGMEGLYSEIILDHYRSPARARAARAVRRRVHQSTRCAATRSPCACDSTRGRTARPCGRLLRRQGCSISQASASVLHDLRGRQGPWTTRWTACEGCGRCCCAGPDQVEPDEDLLEDAVGLHRRGPFPARVKCALLPWAAFTDAMARAGVPRDPEDDQEEDDTHDTHHRRRRHRGHARRGRPRARHQRRRPRPGLRRAPR